MNQFKMLLMMSCVSAAGMIAVGCGDNGPQNTDDLTRNDLVDDVADANIVDVADAADVSDAMDVSDVSDLSDLSDAADAPDLPDIPPVQLCSGRADLCDRRLDQVAFVTTHNSMAVTPDFVFYNQTCDVATQLAMGVRGFMLDTHYLYEDDPTSDPTVLLCHGPCAMGQRPLSDTLTDMRVFLEENPGEIVTIIFESYVSAEHTKASFELAGAVDIALQLQAGQPLPTLQEMVDSNKRLVVLTDRDGGTYPWYLNVWEWAWDNDWDNKEPADLNCDVNRGQGTNPLFIMNHFVTNPMASEELAGQVNVNPFFNDQAFKCQNERSHRPNFVTVDFFEIGDVFAVVDALNASELPQ